MEELTPWIDALRATTLLSPWKSHKIVREVQETHTLWVLWPEIEELPTYDAEMIEYAFQALELFALLHCAGRHDACVDLLQAVWPTPVAEWVKLVPSLRSHGFRVGCKTYFCTPMKFIEWSMAYMFSRESEEDGLRCTRLRTLLENAFSVDDAISIPACLVPVEIGICVNGEQTPSDATGHLTEIAAVAEMQQLSLGAFSRRAMLVAAWFVEDLDEGEFARLDQITSAAESAVTYTPTFQKLFASTTQERCEVGSSWLGVDSVMDQRMASAVFTALMDSQSIRELDISASDGVATVTQLRIWQWVAISVFSRYASNRLDILSIEVDGLSIEDVSEIEAIIQAPSPLGMLFNIPNQNVSTLSTSTFWLSRRTGEPEFSMDMGDLLVRVIDCQEDWFRVLLPGYGPAWVPRSTVQLTPSMENATSQLRVVREIDLRCIAALTESESSSVMLLRVIGHEISCLRITGKQHSNVNITEEWYWEVLRACPRLEVFEINGLDVGTLSVFSKAFDMGFTSIQEFTLCLFDPDTARISELFTDLTDTNKRIARHLRHISVEVTNPNDPIEEVEEVLERMLMNNHYLEKLELTLMYGDAEATMEVPTVKQLDKFHGEPVYGRQGPLALQSKLAFLSLLRGDAQPHTKSRRRLDGGGNGYRAVCQLDQFVVANIFGFAAQSKIRHLSVTVKRS